MVCSLKLDLTTILLQSEITAKKFKTKFVFLRLIFFYSIGSRIN